MNPDLNDFFRQATMQICGSLDIKTAMWNTLKYLENFIPLTGINLVLGEPGLPAIQTLARVTLHKIEKSDRIMPLPPDISDEIERYWTNLDDIMIINRPDTDPACRAMTRLYGRPDMSVMHMRLKIQDQRLFALVAYVLGRDQYKQEHAELLSSLHDPFAIAMSNALKHDEVLKFKEILADDNRYLQQEMLRLSGDEIIGRDRGLKKVFEMVRQVAPLNNPVLLLGETGVGKEVIANAIHYSSPRKNEPFIKVNCGAIPETLIDSELFGHEKGAFTGALAQKRGRFERAHKGTILLDEIGELPQEAQVRLLRVVQNKEIERVGGNKAIPVDIRVIAATHRDLKSMIISNRFREDLWFRLNVFPIKIPPLRERKEDIPALVQYFIKRNSIEKNVPLPPEVAPEVMDQLKAYHWPGNVRELENIVERSLIQQPGNKISDSIILEEFLFKKTGHDDMRLPVQDNEFSEADKTIAMHMKQIINIISSQKNQDNLILPENNTEDLCLDRVVSSHIQKVLQLTGGKINGPGGAAKLLKINPSTLRNRIHKLGISQKKKGFLI